MDKEMWRILPGYEGFYEVSNKGNIKRVSLVNYRFVESRGYHLVKLSRDCRSKSHRLHCLIAAAFLGERPEGLVIDHIDGNKLNNHADNLRYVTQKEYIRKRRCTTKEGDG